MMGMFFAQRVILGKTQFEEVPATLKQQVADILSESGLEDLVTEDGYLPQEPGEDSTELVPGVEEQVTQ